MLTAKIIRHEDGHTVQLPRELRLPAETQEMRVRWEGSRIILEPMHNEDWPEEFWQAFGGMPEDLDRPGQRQP